MHALSHIDSILVIEDEYFIASELAETFTRNGVGSVAVSGSARQCLEMIRRQPVDFATVDISLQDGGCEELVEELVARSIPFVYVTGYSPDDRPALPPAAWLRKPASEPELLAAVLAARPKTGRLGKDEGSSPAV